MLPLVRNNNHFRNWATGCITKGNPLETVENADLTGENQLSPTERKSTGRMKPPAVALESQPEQRTGILGIQPKDGITRRASLTPITAGTAAKTESKITEDPGMPATATQQVASLSIEPMPIDRMTRVRPVKTSDRVMSSRTAAARLAQRDQIVLENLPLVKAIAVRVHENLPVHVDLDDLVHAGILGLFDAATKFDAEKMVSFSSYAKHRIKGAILDSLRQLDWASRDLRRRHKQLEAATRELAGELHRAPSEAELATKMGVDVERWRQMMIDLRNVGLVSASQRPADQEDLPAPDFPAAAELQPDNMCSQQQLRSALGEAMKSLPERYQKVVALYYTNELTMKEIGGMLGINESRVSQIHKTALEKMAVVLQEAGIRSSAAF
jgi:RNA polymerase sigma factor for flagellar operon FliA